MGSRFDVGTALIHLGGVRFPVTGPARYTMNAAEAIRVAEEFGLSALVPIHYEGWKHFRQGQAAVERAFARSRDREPGPLAEAGGAAARSRSEIGRIAE